MVFNNEKVFLLIYIMVMLTRSSQGQTTGPTVTSAVSIVPGSTSVFSIPKPTSINLTSDFISGVVPTSTPSTSPTEMIFITASSSSIIPSTSVGGSTSVESSKLSASDLGAIIGGCAGGLLLLSIITALCCVRQRKKRAKKEYDLSRGVSASMIFSKDVYKQQEAFDLNNTPLRQQQQQFATNPNDPTVKRYNVDNDKTQIDDEQEVVTPPVILYTDNHNQQINNSTSPLPRQQLTRGVSQASKGARLSKYNFLSQAFSQMRTSYGGQALHGQPNHASEEEPKASFRHQPAAPEPSFDKKNAGGVDRTYHDSMVLSPYEFAGNQYSDNNSKKRYQMYSMYENANSSTDSNGVRGGSTLTPPQQHSTSTFFNPSRESTMTVGTLHAPLFHQQHQHNPTPPPFNKNLYTSGVITPSMDRDSIISDVSQYSTPRQETPTATTNTTTTTNNNTANKPYPYF